MGAEQSQESRSDSKLQQLNRLEAKYGRMNKGTHKAEKVRDKIMFLRGYLGVQGSGLLTTAELKVGERYKQLSDRHATGFDTCKTVTRKEHLRDGKNYALTFHQGKKRIGKFYNITDKPIFKRCATRRHRRSRRRVPG